METMTWRNFCGQKDAPRVTVVTYATPTGKLAVPKNSRMVHICHVPRDEALRMLRTGQSS